MGRIFAEIVKDELVITTHYESCGYIIPNKLNQEKIAVVVNAINNNLDSDNSYEVIPDTELAVSRRDFLFKLLSLSDDCVARYSLYGKGLYSCSDMDKGITLGEVAYLLHYVGGIAKTLKWGSITPEARFNVCVLQELVNGNKLINEKLSMYKNRCDMDYYIKAMKNGDRYIPLPLYCAFVDFINNENVEIDVNLDLLFKVLSKNELDILLGG